MLDINYLRQNPDEVKEMLRRRQMSEDAPKVDRILERDTERKTMVQHADDLKALRNRVSKDIANIKRTGQGSGDELIRQMKTVSDQIADLDVALSTLEGEIEELLLTLPNRLHESVPEGRSAEENVLCKGPVSFEHSLDFPVRNHLDLGKSLGILDFERGAKISGAGFPVYTGKGARLERALINFMLDTHSANHGYTEVFPPFMVNQDSLRGTGQWPKFADQVYHMPEDGLYAIPTAEVPVTNLHRGEMLDAASLPIAYAAYPACFRREAGSYGKETKGFLRTHQFNKVEQFIFCKPEDSWNEFDLILDNTIELFKGLEIPFRTVVLSTGDMGRVPVKTIDVEGWFPSQKAYRELGSCSNCTDFQARRGMIRYKTHVDDKTKLLHTLNASSLALPRLMVAIIETYQNADGTITIPDVLKPFYL